MQTLGGWSGLLLSGVVGGWLGAASLMGRKRLPSTGSSDQKQNHWNQWKILLPQPQSQGSGGGGFKGLPCGSSRVKETTASSGLGSLEQGVFGNQSIGPRTLGLPWLLSAGAQRLGRKPPEQTGRIPASLGWWNECHTLGGS